MAPRAATRRGQVEGGNAQEGGGKGPCRRRRSLGDWRTIEVIRGVKCDACHTLSGQCTAFARCHPPPEGAFQGPGGGERVAPPDSANAKALPQGEGGTGRVEATVRP